MLIDVEHSQKNLIKLYLADLSQYVLVNHMSIGRLLLIALQCETSIGKSFKIIIVPEIDILFASYHQSDQTAVCKEWQLCKTAPFTKCSILANVGMP